MRSGSERKQSRNLRKTRRSVVRLTIDFETTTVIASGPSLLQSDVEAVRGKTATIVVNENYLLAPWADVLYAADYRWWVTRCPQFDGQKWSVWRLASGERDWSAAEADRRGVNLIEGINKPGLSFESGLIHLGGNGGYQAINLAVQLGAKRVLLLGFDMQRTGGRTHHHPDHGKGLRNPGDPEFAEWAQKMAGIRCPPWLEIINCSRETALTCFPRMNIEDALSEDVFRPRAVSG